MATLGTLFTGTWAMMGGSKKEQAKQGPPINASSKDEENFIQYVAAEMRTARDGDCAPSV